MSRASMTIVTRGAGKLPEKKTQKWAELLCSRSSGGCGSVFWANEESGKEESEEGGGHHISLGWMTHCPTCNKKVGGESVEFVDLAEPPKDTYQPTTKYTRGSPSLDKD